MHFAQIFCSSLSMDSESISSQVNTAFSVCFCLIFVILVGLLILLLFVISNTLQLNDSMEKINEIAENLTQNHAFFK